MKRRTTRSVKVRHLVIGGEAPVSIQSMTKTDTTDIEATVRQVRALATAGCEIVRVAVPTIEASKALADIRREADKVPLVADIHFHPQFAIAAIEAGFDKIRWNPGNIRNTERVREVVERAKERGIPIRVGVNVGSLDPECEAAHKGNLVEAIVQSALKSVRLLEGFGFYDVVLSLKSSDVPQMLAAYRRMAQLCDYPFHLGVTEAGLPDISTVKSSIGIGALLAEGIGDTIRVSITGDPIEEVKVAQRILSSLNLRRFETNVIACPSCGRCEIDVVGIANQVQARLSALAKTEPRCLDLTVAVMGCVVNGPGESEHADIGLAGGGGVGVIYRKGRQIRRVPEAQMVDALLDEVQQLLHSAANDTPHPHEAALSS
ncbi:MAG: 4-hydroxy-3-methylbut-2-en-1-yl diphosphate synthase [Candidatus Omnitrophica bacterium CG11_big_fil_rev_8_21_14_0_20_63_9]|nr:MAG: 4-hydroxy-3-methylbut-2-en-1-yl diphosphate synthase [Candidatus Omnitrophica bacterium CG11_big_fil_rev_8_21_14_0_20_63_9]